MFKLSNIFHRDGKKRECGIITWLIAHFTRAFYALTSNWKLCAKHQRHFTQQQKAPFVWTTFYLYLTTHTEWKIKKNFFFFCWNQDKEYHIKYYVSVLCSYLIWKFAAAWSLVSHWFLTNYSALKKLKCQSYVISIGKNSKNGTLTHWERIRECVVMCQLENKRPRRKSFVKTIQLKTSTLVFSYI